MGFFKKNEVPAAKPDAMNHTHHMVEVSRGKDDKGEYIDLKCDSDVPYPCSQGTIREYQ